MGSGPGLAAAVTMLVVAAVVVRAGILRGISRRRLRGETLAARPAAGEETVPPPALPRRRWTVAAAAAALAALGLAAGAPLVLTVSLVAVAAIAAWLVEGFVHGRGLALIEAQLADAIDIVVGAVRAGGGTVAALEAAQRASAPPLRAQLEEVVGRLKLGDDPAQVLRELTVRVPLETVRLFALTLSVHWEAGGSLAPALGTTSRTIRDRIDLSRRVRSQSMEAQASVVGFMAIVYGLGYILWQANPERMRIFLSSSLGMAAVAAAVFMQAVGLLWISRIIRVRF